MSWAYNIYLKLRLRPYILERFCWFFSIQIYIREQDLVYRIWPWFSMAGRQLLPFHLSASQKRNKPDFLCSSFNSGHQLTTNKCLAGQDFVPCVTITLCTFEADTESSRISPTKYSLVLNLQVNTSHPRAPHINFWDRHKSNTAYLTLMQCLMRAKVRESFYMTTASLTANMLSPGDKAFRQLPPVDCSGYVLAPSEHGWNRLGCFPHHRGSPGVLPVATRARCSVLLTFFFSFPWMLDPFWGVGEATGAHRLRMSRGHRWGVRQLFQSPTWSIWGVWYLAPGYFGSTLKVSWHRFILSESLSNFVQTRTWTEIPPLLKPSTLQTGMPWISILLFNI